MRSCSGLLPTTPKTQSDKAYLAVESMHTIQITHQTHILTTRGHAGRICYKWHTTQKIVQETHQLAHETQYIVGSISLARSTCSGSGSIAGKAFKINASPRTFFILRCWGKTPMMHEFKRDGKDPQWDFSIHKCNLCDHPLSGMREEKAAQLSLPGSPKQVPYLVSLWHRWPCLWHDCSRRRWLLSSRTCTWTWYRWRWRFKRIIACDKPLWAIFILGRPWWHCNGNPLGLDASSHRRCCVARWQRVYRKGVCS